MEGFRSTVFLQSIGFIYAIAFCSIYSQIQGLYGEDGIEPVAVFMNRVQRDLGDQKNPLHSFAHVPSMVWFHSAFGLTPDLMMELLCIVGMFAGTLATANWLITPEAFGTMWLSYLSLSMMGGTFLRNQWDMLLLEVGFLAIWLAPPFGALSTFEAPQAIVWLLRFVYTKYNLMTSFTKILSGCPTWLGLTALDYHFATQEVPNTFSWFAHQLSPGFHSTLAAAGLFIQGPLSLLGISPWVAHRVPVYYINLGLNLLSLFTGNYGFSNVLAIALGYSLMPTSRDTPVLPKRFQILNIIGHVVGFGIVSYLAYSMFEFVYEDGVQTGMRFAWTVGETKQIIHYLLPGIAAVALSSMILSSLYQNASLLYVAIIDLTSFRLRGSFTSCHCIIYTLIGILLFTPLALPLTKLDSTLANSLPDYLKTTALLSSRIRLASAYGNFEKSTGVRKVTVPGTFINEFAIVARPEIVLEASNDDGKTWHEIDLHFKPGNVFVAPKIVAPHQSRLDWQFAVAAKGNYSEHPWLVHFAAKLLHGAPALREFVDNKEYVNNPPKAVRGQLYHYDFTRWNTSWARELPHVEILRANTSNANGTAWWTRTLVKEYLPAIDLQNPSLKKFLIDHGWSDTKITIDSEATCASSTQPMLCKSLTFLHSIPNVRMGCITSFVIFMALKYQLESWLQGPKVTVNATDGEKLKAD